MRLIPIKVQIHCRLCDKEKQEAGGILEGGGGQYLYLCASCFEVLEQLEKG